MDEQAGQSANGKSRLHDPLPGDAMQRWIFQFIDFLPDATFAIDTEGRVIFWNKAMEELTGVAAEKILGQTDYAYAVPLYNERRPVLIDLVLQPNDAIERSYANFMRTGESLYAEDSVPGLDRFLWGKAGPIRDERGRLMGAIESLRDVSERKRMEQACRDSLSTLVQLADFLPDPTFAVDAQGRIILWNKAIEGLSGLSTMEMLGQCVCAYSLPQNGKQQRLLSEYVLHPDLPLPEGPSFRRYEDGSIGYEGDYRFEVTDRNRSVTAHAGPVHDSHGTVIGVIETIRDVTDHKKMGLALRESEERFRILFENATEAIARVSPQGRFLGMNQSFARLIGFTSPQEVIANVKDEGLKLNLHPEDQHAIKRLLEEHGMVEGYELEFMRRDKSRGWASLNVHVVRDAQQQILYYDGIGLDITERKLAEQALRESEEKFRRLFESSADGNLLMEDGRYVDCNAAALRIAGLTEKAQLIDTRPMDKSPERQPNGALSAEKSQHMIALALEKGFHHFEWVRRRSDGSDVHIDVMLTAVPVHGKKLLYTVWRDITDRKQAEVALRESEERYRSLFENAIEGVFQSTPSGQWINVNPSLARIAGYDSPQELIASVKDIAGELYADPEERIAITRILAEHGMVEGFEVAFRHRHGGRIWGSLNVSTVRDRQGTIQYYEGTCVDITDRKQAEQSLRESEEKFRLLFESSADGNLLMERGRCIDCNTAALAIAGCTDKAMLIGAQPADLSPATQPDGTPSAIKVRRMLRIAQSRGSHRFEWLMRRFDGAPAHLDVMLTSVPVQGKKLIHVIWRDITDRKRTEAALGESEERYRILFENATVGIFRSTPSGRFLIANPAFARMGGFPSPQELIDSIQDVATQHYVNAKDRYTLLQLLEEHDKVEGFEVEVLSRDKSRFWISLNMRTVRDAEGNILYYDGTDINITDRKRAEAALRESEEQYRILFENATEGIFRSTPAGRFLTVNPSLARMAGFATPGEMIGAIKDIGQELYAHPGDRQGIGRILAEQDRVEGYEVEFIRHDGRRVWVSMNIHAVRVAQGAIRYYDGTCVDITERKRMEQDLRESEEKFRLLFESSADGYLIIENGRIIDCNEAALMITGYQDKSQLVGMRPEDFSPEMQPNGIPSQAKARCMMDATLQQGSQRFEWTHRRIDGASIDVEVMLTAVTMQEKQFLFATWRDISGHKQAEAELRASEERYRILFENATEGIFRTTPAGRFMHVNPSFARMVGFASPQEVVDTIKDIASELYVVPAERSTLLRLLEEHDKVEGFEIEFLRRDKSGFWMSINIHTVRDEAGNILYLDGTCIDFTERKLAEERLRESEHRLAQIIDFLPDPTLAIDMEGRILVWNKAMEDMTGVKAAAILGKSDHAYALPFYGKRAPILADLCLKPDPEAEKQYAFIRKEENLLIAEAEVMHNKLHAWGKASRIFDRRGEPIGAIETIRDITDRKKAENRLRMSEERYRLVAENIHDIITVYDLNFTYTYVSSSIERITGYRPQEMIGMPALDFVTGESKIKMEAILNQIRELMHAQDPHLSSWSWTVELSRIVKSGEIMWTESNISFLLDERGTPLGILSVTRDIDERKRSQEQMNLYQDHLQRTQKLEAIGTLAGGIAHDFNNILSVIIGYSELIRDELSPESRSRKKILEVLKGGERAKDLVKQILTFSRQVESQATPLDIHLIVKEALKLLRATIPTTIAIEQAIDPHAGTVLADPVQIQQVVMNLCTNAYHAMQEESGVLAVNLQAVTLEDGSLLSHAELHAGDYVKLTVRDTGCGMDEATQRRAFEPFFTTKEPGQGTGLGLSISHGIVKRLGGAIILASTPGAGSTFEVFLPRFGIDVAPDTDEAEIIPVGNGECILLVDDETDIISFGRIMLEQIGYAVQGCSVSSEALEIFRANPQVFALVITDQTMPGLRGDQLAEAMLAIRPGLPIILMTGYSTVVDHEGALRQGIREFIPKPFSMSTMAQAIHRALHNPGEPEGFPR